MKKSKLEKPTYIDVELKVLAGSRLLFGYVTVVVPPEQAAFYASKGVDLVSLIDSSLSRSIGCFFPSNSIVSLDVCIIDPSLVDVSGPFVLFDRCDRFQLVSKLVFDVLRQFL